MVGHRDRAETLLARGGEQHLDRRRAVAGVVGVHVQVDVDQRRPRAGGAAPGRPSPSWRRAASALVDLLELVGGSARRAGGAPGKWRPSAQPSRGRLAVRASRRPKKLSTKRRARASRAAARLEEWKEPTFSAREWRSAEREVLGANGSCTWTKSSATEPAVPSVRATSIGSATAVGLGPRRARRRAPRRARGRGRHLLAQRRAQRARCSIRPARVAARRLATRASARRGAAPAASTAHRRALLVRDEHEVHGLPRCRPRIPRAPRTTSAPAQHDAVLAPG